MRSIASEAFLLHHTILSLWVVRMSDLRYTAASQLEHLHSRYTGTINADTEK